MKLCVMAFLIQMLLLYSFIPCFRTMVSWTIVVGNVDVDATAHLKEILPEVANCFFVFHFLSMCQRMRMYQG